MRTRASQGKTIHAVRIFIVAAALAMLAAIISSTALRANTPDFAKNMPGPKQQDELFPLGAQIYREHCAACHDSGAGRAPQRVVLGFMTPEAILHALTSGAMSAQGSSLSEEQKVAVAQHLTQKKIGSARKASAAPMCKGERAKFDRGKVPPFVNWGLDDENSHGIATGVAGIDRSNVKTLKLKWAFAFPDANRARSQPALGGGAIFVGSQDGTVYALDRETGCVRWTFKAATEVRTGIVLSPWQAGDDQANPLAFFGDFAGNAYAVEAFTGKLAWKVEADTHPATVITGTPALHGDTLYLPVSSLEEGAAAFPDYKCCTFRGSVLALDAKTGAIKWRRWLVPEAQLVKSEEPDGVDFFGPSGVAVWTAPAIDAARGRIYVTTGDNYSNPTSELSDSIVALDMKTGAVVWHYQATRGDAWTVACVTRTGGYCPDDSGPDFDFGAGPVLAIGGDGKQYLLAGQKSGIAFALDPDTGQLAWQQRLGRGGMSGGVHFGIAATEGTLFVPVSDLPDGKPSDFPLSPGVYALDIASGKRLWAAPAPDVCGGRKLCVRGYGGAITVTSELVFAGSEDGHLRIFDSKTGETVWDFDTARDFETVNGVKGFGGAISGGAAPIAHDGQLLVSSGYGFISNLPGNVLLVFEAE